MKIFNSRPIDTSNRLPQEISVYNLLDKYNISYTRADHKHADTMEDCDEISKALGVRICKNLFLCNRQKTNFYLLLLPDNKQFKTKELSHQINSARLSFASSNDMVEMLNVTPGSASILALMNDISNKVTLLIDEDVLRFEYIGCHPCINTSSLKIKTSDIVNVFLPAVKHNFTVVKLLGAD